MSSDKILAKDLIQKYHVVVEIPDTKVAGFSDGFISAPGGSFSSDKVTIIRVNTNSKNSSQIVYFDETKQCEAAIVVPNNFLFRAANEETTKHLMTKFREWMLKNLWQHCHYLGAAIGSDPEIFCEDEKGNLIPAFNFLGSKEHPDKSTNVMGCNTNNIYWDGFQAEFTTDPRSCMQQHASSLFNGLHSLRNKLIQKYPKAKLSAKTVFDIPLNLLKDSKDEHVAFGCRESLNAYGLKGIVAPGREVTYRSTGGHIHFGLGDKLASDKDGIVRMVKALDAVLGVACVSMFAKYDDPRRRQMYGLAGEYRLPVYGFEYRTLSNAWLFHPLIAHLVFDLARSTTTFGYKEFLKYWECDEAETIRIINECDVDAAREVLKRNKKILIQIINTRYNNFEKSAFVYDIFYHGMESVLHDPTNVTANWLLGNPNGFSGAWSSPVHASYIAPDKV